MVWYYGDDKPTTAVKVDVEVSIQVGCIVVEVEVGGKVEVGVDVEFGVVAYADVAIVVHADVTVITPLSLIHI